MAKITLDDISGGYLSVAVYNANNTAIEAAIENTLSRDGTSPNTMSANLDMNSNKITNLTDGTNNQDAVTLKQLTDAGTITVSTAATTSVEDTAGNFTGTNVESVLAELFAATAGWEDGDTGHYLDGFEVRSTDAVFLITESDAPANEGKYRFRANGGELYFQTMNDAEDSFGTVFRVNRTAETIDSVLWFCQISMGDRVLAGAQLVDYSIKSTDGVIAAGSITFTLSTSNAYEVELTSNITSITLSNAPPTGQYGELIIKFIQDGTGSRTVAGWPASVKWPSGAAPVITTTATTGVDIVTLKTWDGGTTWYGNFSQDYS